MKNVDYRGLAALDAVVGLGSFEKAALSLHVSQSAISQRIRTLEELSGQLLIVRAQPPFATTLGQRLIAHYRQVKLMEAALESDIGEPASLPEIAIAVNADTLATWLPDALAPVLKPPQCQLTVLIDDQDHTLQLLREGSVFGCVTSSMTPVAGTTATPLGVERYICAASPAFARTWFKYGFTTAAVAQAPAVVFNQKDALHARFLRQRLGWQSAYPHHSIASVDAFEKFIQRGFGYGMLPTVQIATALASGQLVDLCPGEGIDVPLVWHAWNIHTPLTASLSRHIIDIARQSLNYTQPEDDNLK
ncbi:LysR family transcriptional regulator ArgP [Glaciimonas immobilis]|uniref:LysR family transcriptional regulator (Chromosome initiation inhibitor) n=1 Tax=Glaciimonas immobilis TaxID=728004 RepID=A0A840RRR5_9BURK|nr:LysR family transcriptional regulator ArgP [Glaciimonas immobilis]KAF3996802.1 LysR family transcriptional regulator ArgP [Glaciimonas immobilis]MBB5199656.1 LysR family transcriptional regulator (chromosome initiation inhibitor) [Glaciimonas immobilis]